MALRITGVGQRKHAVSKAVSVQCIRLPGAMVEAEGDHRRITRVSPRTMPLSVFRYIRLSVDVIPAFSQLGLEPSRVYCA